MKYPKTKYFSFSPSKNNTDVKECGLFNINDFIDKKLIVTAKMDGSNCLMDRDHVAARNGYDANHLSFDIIKAMHSTFCNKIPENLVIFGENMYATHSIHYTNLDSYLYIFAVYDKVDDVWFSWNDIYKISEDIRIPRVPVIAVIDPTDKIDRLIDIICNYGDTYIKNGGEGIVVRDVSSFPNHDFYKNVAKYVRANHVATDEHWSKQPIKKNIIKK